MEDEIIDIDGKVCRNYQSPAGQVMAWQIDRKAAGLLVLSGGIGLAGCHSAVSTHVEQGPFGFGWKTQKLKGIPITVSVPTHLRIEVIELKYLDPKTNCLIADASGRPLSGRRIEAKIQERDEVFTVDAVRPAAGNHIYEAGFDKQYFKTLNTKVEDKTIQDITAVLSKFDPTPPKPAAKGTGNALETVGGTAPILIESTIAAEIFDLHDPCMEDRVREFLRQYANGCRDCPPPLMLGACPPAKAAGEKSSEALAPPKTQIVPNSIPSK